MVMAPDYITKKCDISFVLRYIPRMPKRESGRATAIAAYDNFLYLLAGMEMSLERGTIQWTAESAEAAQHRLANVLAGVMVIAARLRGG
jgi:hypothetical protein